ncbi:hypothetical protein ACTXT7_015402 [Hymenolepis weldensis]
MLIAALNNDHQHLDLDPLNIPIIRKFKKVKLLFVYSEIQGPVLTAVSSNGVTITEQSVKAANNQWQHLENATRNSENFTNFDLRKAAEIKLEKYSKKFSKEIEQRT